jgi:hypothetical protein
MNKVKIVFTDLDSTLTGEKGKIDIKNKIIFKKLKDKGIPVVINTGRPLPYIIPICKQYETSNYVISSNGAEIYNISAKKVIFRDIISKDNLKKLDEFVEKYELFFMANSLDKRYTNKEDAIGFIKVKSLYDIDEDISQVILESYDIEKMKYLRKSIEDETDLIIANKTKHISKNKLLYYDVVNSTVSKGNALKILCKHLGIDNERAMAIGDSDNDIEMLLASGYKVAVANATEKLKNVADIVTLSNKQNGVETILNEFYSQI